MSDKTIRNAVVLAAGLGTRMRPITQTMPKPLVQVHNKTLLDHALDALAETGVTNAAINVHYLPEQIEKHVEQRLHPHCAISDERDELLDSGGGVKKALGLLNPADEFFILNADSFWLDGAFSNLPAMTKAWNSDAMDMLLLISPTSQSVGFSGLGDFFMDDTGRLARRGEAPEAPYVYAGAIIAKAGHLKSVPEDKFSLNRLFDEAIAANRLYGHSLDGLWLHVGTPDAISEAERAIARYRNDPQ